MLRPWVRRKGNGKKPQEINSSATRNCEPSSAPESDLLLLGTLRVIRGAKHPRNPRQAFAVAFDFAFSRGPSADC